MSYFRALLFIFSLWITACASVNNSPNKAEIPLPCLKDESRQKLRSDELQKIVAADQADRQNWENMTPEKLRGIAIRDLERRKRVGEIFGEGCLVSARDFAAGALVFQHGDAPDHFYQTFIWSKRAVELGDKSQKSLMALGVDRYLVNTGRKQLLASQAHQAQVGGCACLQQVDSTFPDRLRIEYTGKSLADALSWVKGMNAGKRCKAPPECADKLRSAPKGTFPGIW